MCRVISIMPIFEDALAFLGQFMTAGKTRPAARRHAPANALAHAEIPPVEGLSRRARSKRFDAADDFVAKHRRRLHLPPSGMRMQIARAQGAARDANYDFALVWLRGRTFDDFERPIGSMEKHDARH
jgi:hypothetical protein